MDASKIRVDDVDDASMAPWEFEAETPAAFIRGDVNLVCDEGDETYSTWELRVMRVEVEPRAAGDWKAARTIPYGEIETRARAALQAYVDEVGKDHSWLAMRASNAVVRTPERGRPASPDTTRRDMVAALAVLIGQMAEGVTAPTPFAAELIAKHEGTAPEDARTIRRRLARAEKLGMVTPFLGDGREAGVLLDWWCTPDGIEYGHALDTWEGLHERLSLQLLQLDLAAGRDVGFCAA